MGQNSYIAFQGTLKFALGIVLEFGIENWNFGIGAGMLADTKFQNSKKFLLKMTSVPELEPRKLLIYKALSRKNSKIPRFQRKCVRFPFGAISRHEGPAAGA